MILHILFSIDEGDLYSIGNNWAGQLGNGNDVNVLSRPVKIASIPDLKKIVLGVFNSFYILSKKKKKNVEKIFK